MDGEIVCLFLALNIWLGFWSKRHVKDLAGYVVAGRNVKIALGVANLMVTETGTAGLVYLGQLGYMTGFSCFIIALLYFATYYLVGYTGFVVSDLRRLEIMTIPEFYQLRYTRGVRLIGGLILFLSGILNMGVFLKFDGIFFSEIMGFGQGQVVAVMTAMLIVAVGYGIVGGMMSVTVTGFMQFCFLAFTMLSLTFGMLYLKGFRVVAQTVEAHFGSAGFNPIVNHHFGWTFIFWILVTNFSISFFWQPDISKALAAKNPEAGRKVYLYTGLLFAGRTIMPMFWGATALAVLGSGVPTLAAMPRMLGQLVPSGLLGLVAGMLLCAAMATYGAYMLAWATVAARDVCSCIRPDGLSERTTITIMRICMVFEGIFLLAFGIWYEISDTAFQYLTIAAGMYFAGALSCVIAGLYWKKANSVGAYCALILGALGPTGYLLVEKFRDELPAWIGFLGNVNISGLLSFLLAAAGMAMGSLLTQRFAVPVRLKGLQKGADR